MSSRRTGKVIYLQISAAVVSLLLGLFNLGKESKPLVQKIQQNVTIRKQQENMKKATEISQMNIQWQYKNYDGLYQYYADPSERYWCRVNNQGIVEYSENPQYNRMAQIKNIIR